MKLISKTREGSRVLKKYDQAQTPYQCVQDADSVAEASKQELRKQYEELDPIHLLISIEKLQDQLWPFAYLASGLTNPSNSQNGAQLKMSRPTQTYAGPSKQAEAHSTGPILEKTDRMYRRTQKKRQPGLGKRWWRTRPDPFSEVWAEVEQKLGISPYAGAKALFMELQQQYPGKFPIGQLRTFQRRIKDWRVEQATGRIEGEITANVLSTIPGNGVFG